MRTDLFWSKVEKTETCWNWTGFTAQGYGLFSHRRAHRLAYELLVGPIPEGLVLDHLCRVRHCVNPDHLEPVTPEENKRRGFGGPRNGNACRKGLHGWPEESIIRKGQRVCGPCTHASDNRRGSRPVECECGATLTYGALGNHRRSIKHRRAVAE